ncbi:D-amino-acid dehydrogenase [Paracoccus isoporae]|uniref:D-amino-acid dehydrogenase n=1 Tax=Paracoccus isoporae TaxID=591205 RepID=A0A1G6U419_9RHOB|nr:FAD-dependent oxidoreductase [Paracoccus isoporae]SDD36079.1 D-amino-acid dehydrogenase [Paracoccus isoporae]
MQGSMAQAAPLHVAVIGAGVIGASTALALLADGHRVTLLDPAAPGGRQAASFGNGAFISPASVIPMSHPGIWRKVPGYLLDPAGPLTIRWRDAPRLAPWVWRFVMAGRSAAHVERTACALAALLGEAPRQHLGIAERIGRPDLIRQDGLIHVFTDRAAYEAEAPAWTLRRRLDVRIAEMSEAELRERLPELSQHYRFGIRVVDGAHCTDPGGYVAAMLGWARRQGAVLRRASVTGFRVEEGKLRALRCGADELDCDRAVIACGIGARDLARAAGDRIPLQSERGYHVEIADPPIRPECPVMPQEGRMANVVTQGGFRAAGQVELASPHAAPDWRRAEILLAHLRRSWPALNDVAEAQVSRWMGHRPSTPDGRPVIGPASGATDIIHAFGHGHIGLAAAPMTARLVADLLAGRAGPVDLSPYAPTRFRRG